LIEPVGHRAGPIDRFGGRRLMGLGPRASPALAAQAAIDLAGHGPGAQQALDPRADHGPGFVV